MAAAAEMGRKYKPYIVGHWWRRLHGAAGNVMATSSRGCRGEAQTDGRGAAMLRRPKRATEAAKGAGDSARWGASRIIPIMVGKPTPVSPPWGDERRDAFLLRCRRCAPKAAGRRAKYRAEGNEYQC